MIDKFEACHAITKVWEGGRLVINNFFILVFTPKGE